MDVSDQKTKDKKDNRPQIVHANDVNQALKNNRYKSEESFTKDYIRRKKTIMDMPLSEVVDRTLNFITYSDDGFSESLDSMKERLGNSSMKGVGKVKLYFLSFLDFCTRNDSLIYLGIWLVLLSIIIYFLNITISR